MYFYFNFSCITNIAYISGFVKFLEGYYIIVITQRTKVAVIGPHVIYKVMNTAMIPIPNDIVKYTHPEESRFVFSKLYKSANYAPLLLMESSPGQVELSSIKLVFTSSPLSM